MMNNLFSIFDPTASQMSLCWLMMLSLISIPIWKTATPLINFLLKEASFTLNKTKKSETAILLALFTTILSMNMSALFPQVFSLTSHLVITLPLALTTWLSINLFGWIKNSNHMLTHLVPQGTPMALMSFMVMIELSSNLIRPITLCVRLTANLIAGHLLMTLLGNALINMTTMNSMTAMAIPLTLTILEFAVAIIQSYVFMTLITLYITETK